MKDSVILNIKCSIPKYHKAVLNTHGVHGLQLNKNTRTAHIKDIKNKVLTCTLFTESLMCIYFRNL